MFLINLNSQIIKVVLINTIKKKTEKAQTNQKRISTAIATNERRRIHINTHATVCS